MTMSTPASGSPSGVVMIFPWFAIATVPNAATPIPTALMATIVQFCWAICVPRATTSLYRMLIG